MNIYIYGVYTVILAGKSQNIRSYTVYIYSSGQPYVYLVVSLSVIPPYIHRICVILANPSYVQAALMRDEAIQMQYDTLYEHSMSKLQCMFD